MSQSKLKKLKAMLEKGVISQEAYKKGLAALGIDDRTEVTENLVSAATPANKQSQPLPVGKGAEDEEALGSLERAKFRTVEADGAAQRTVVNKARTREGISFEEPNVNVEDIERRGSMVAGDGKPSQAYLDALEAMKRAGSTPGPAEGSSRRGGSANASLEALRKKGFRV